MSLFQSFCWSLAEAEAELLAFKTWFDTAGYRGEKEIVFAIKSRPHMCGLLAANAGFSAPDRISFELELQGLFRTDLILGNSVTRQFALVEFEPAEDRSIFSKRRTRQYRHWSRALEHGFGQVVDWAWVMSDHRNDTTLTNAFEGAVGTSAFIVVCGRDAGLRDDMERRRFHHRRNSVRIDGVPALVLTYDDMVRVMDLSLRHAKSFTSL